MMRKCAYTKCDKTFGAKFIDTVIEKQYCCKRHGGLVRKLRRRAKKKREQNLQCCHCGAVLVGRQTTWCSDRCRRTWNNQRGKNHE